MGSYALWSLVWELVVEWDCCFRFIAEISVLLVEERVDSAEGSEMQRCM